MKRRFVLVLAGVAVPAAFALTLVPAGPAWPQWRGPVRTGVAPDFAARTAWPAALRPA